jgi:hypothetical protein
MFFSQEIVSGAVGIAVLRGGSIVRYIPELHSLLKMHPIPVIVTNKSKLHGVFLPDDWVFEPSNQAPMY